MLIHEVVKRSELKHEIDPVHGHVARSVDTLKPGSTHTITHDGETYERLSDGSFDLPVEHAAFFLNQPTWFEGPSPFEAEAKPSVSERLRATSN